LGISLGYPPDPPNPLTIPIIEGILEKCQGHGVPFGLFAQSMPNAKHFAKLGASILVCGSDLGFALEGAERSLNELQTALNG
jgi:2-keto-3-deoxy-L-rhamnonate aldolase RhmA